LAPGEWTDDTSMALALANSIINVGWDLDDQAERYLRWWRHGEYSVTGTCFDIGNATRSALARFERERDTHTSGSDSEHSAGNGSIMRMAPVVIAYLDYPDLIERCVESSYPTHRAPQCLSACAYFGAVLAALMRGMPRDEAVSPEADHVKELIDAGLHPAIEEVARGSFLTREPPQIVGSGYVVKSLEAALWAFVGADNFEDAVLRAVNLGDDADTTGAICGQLAGAHWGVAGIPDHLLDGVAWRDQIESVGEQLVTVT
jgi:ADP-ribosyl-[dinitrogen reductase] hydrolase